MRSPVICNLIIFFRHLKKNYIYGNYASCSVVCFEEKKKGKKPLKAVVFEVEEVLLKDNF